MSSILKALRKLEEEKARRDPGKVDIAHDILRRRTGRRAASRGRGALLAGVALAVVLGLSGGLAWWLLGGGNATPSSVVGAPDPSAAPVSAPLATRPAGEEPGKSGAAVSTGESDTLPAGEETSRSELQTSGRPANPSPLRAPRSATPAALAGPATGGAAAPVDEADGSAKEEVAAAKEGRAVSQGGQTDKTSAKSGRGAEAVGAGLVLNGIAWQTEREGRMAIINDLPVMEGTDIEGARVVEILPETVRLEKDGIPFVLELE